MRALAIAFGIVCILAGRVYAAPLRVLESSSSSRSSAISEAETRSWSRRPLFSIQKLQRESTPSASAGAGVSGAIDWIAIAACESGGAWSINTGNGYYGGLQMDLTFWTSYGGTKYAARPDLASEAEQISVAAAAVPSRGLSPWPYCGRFG